VLVVVRYQGVMEALSWLLTLPYLISFAIGQRHARNAYVTLSIVAGVGVGSSLFLAVLFGAITSLLSERCEGNDTPDCCGACLDQSALMNSHIFAFTPSRLTILLYICFNIVSPSALHSISSRWHDHPSRPLHRTICHLRLVLQAPAQPIPF
jgi:hypothetical protein